MKQKSTIPLSPIIPTWQEVIEKLVRQYFQRSIKCDTCSHRDFNTMGDTKYKCIKELLKKS